MILFMSKKKFKQVIREAVIETLKDSEGEQTFGIIVMKALNLKLDYEIEIEDGHSEKGKTTLKKQRINVLHHLAKYMPYIEGAIRGVQSDAAQARNRSSEVLASIQQFKKDLKDYATFLSSTRRIGDSLKKVIGIENKKNGG